jgi:hypothetical protein
MTGTMKDIAWFKETAEPQLKGYEIKYSYYEKGDFGSLNQAEFNSKKIGGNVDFWGLGWLGVFVWNYETDKQLINVLVEAGKEVEKEKALMELLQILKKA